MNPSPILEKIAADKAAAKKAEKFEETLNAIDQACKDKGFASYAEFEREMESYVAVAPVALIAPAAPKASVSEKTEVNKDANGVTLNKDGTPRSPRTIYNQVLCDQMKAKWEELNDDAKVCKALNLKMVSYLKYKAADWDFEAAKKAAAEDAKKK